MPHRRSHIRASAKVARIAAKAGSLLPHVSVLRDAAILPSMGFIFDLLVELLVPGPWRRKSAVFDCNLRVIDGSQVGLGDGWHYGDVTVHPGRLEFVVGFELRDGLLKGFRKPPPPISVTVGTVATERQRKPNDSEKWKVSVDREIVELTTDTAILEWAVPTKRLKSALERLQSSEVSPG